MGDPLSILDGMTIGETEVTLAWARALARAPDADATIRQAMAALSDVLEMGVAVANRLVAADDEYEVCLVSGPDEIPVGNLLGSRYAQASFERVISGRYERAPGVHLIPPDAPEWAEFDGDELIPELEPPPASEHPWLPGQELFVVLRDREERVLTVISLDVPHDRELPSAPRLVLAALVAHHAGTSLEARIAERANERARDEADALAGIVASLEAGLTEQQLVERAVDGIRNVCGYDTVEAHLLAAEAGARGDWPPYAPAHAISRSYLVRHDELAIGGWPMPAELYEGGRGRRGWHRKTLVIPIDLPSKERLGVLLADNPRDRLLPSLAEVRRLEAFATQIGLMIGAGRSLERARVRAETDPLTRLANRERLYDEIARALDAQLPVSVLFLDLDGFKAINDTFGHRAGDELLRHVARRLERTVRPGALVARLAGDEFVIACIGDEAGQIAPLCDRALAALREPFALDSAEVEIEASAGSAESTEGTTVDGLIHEADMRMYEAKAASRAPGPRRFP
jgi:diguanylate cyclase (GGDEF)-like protein